MKYSWKLQTHQHLKTLILGRTSKNEYNLNSYPQTMKLFDSKAKEPGNLKYRDFGNLSILILKLTF